MLHVACCIFLQSYYPKYAKDGVVRSVYSVNVPYDFPVLAFGENEHYKVGARQ